VDLLWLIMDPIVSKHMIFHDIHPCMFTVCF